MHMYDKVKVIRKGPRIVDKKFEDVLLDFALENTTCMHMWESKESENNWPNTI